MNVTNAQVQLALLSFLVLVAAPATTLAWRSFDAAVLLLSGLSGPFCLLLVPVAVVAWWQGRTRSHAERLACVLLAAAVQGRVAAPAGPARRLENRQDAGRAARGHAGRAPRHPRWPDLLRRCHGPRDVRGRPRERLVGASFAAAAARDRGAPLGRARRVADEERRAPPLAPVCGAAPRSGPRLAGHPGTGTRDALARAHDAGRRHALLLLRDRRLPRDGRLGGLRRCEPPCARGRRDASRGPSARRRPARLPAAALPGDRLPRRGGALPRCKTRSGAAAHRAKRLDHGARAPAASDAIAAEPRLDLTARRSRQPRSRPASQGRSGATPGPSSSRGGSRRRPRRARGRPSPSPRC